MIEKIVCICGEKMKRHDGFYICDKCGKKIKIEIKLPGNINN